MQAEAVPWMRIRLGGGGWQGLEGASSESWRAQSWQGGLLGVLSIRGRVSTRVGELRLRDGKALECSMTESKRPDAGY